MFSTWYEHFNDLSRRRTTDKSLHHKAFNIAKNPKCDGYHHGLASMVYNFFDKETSGVAVKSKIMLNQQLAQEIRKLIIRRFEKWKLHSSFIDNIWVVNLADIQLISRFSKSFRFLLCVTDIYSKYAWFAPLKDQKVTSIANIFLESNHKPSKVWVDEGTKFYK